MQHALSAPGASGRASWGSPKRGAGAPCPAHDCSPFPAPRGGGRLCNPSSQLLLSEPCLGKKPGQPAHGPVCMTVTFAQTHPPTDGTGLTPSPGPGTSCILPSVVCAGPCRALCRTPPHLPSGAALGDSCLGDPYLRHPRNPSVHLPQLHRQIREEGLGLGLCSPRALQVKLRPSSHGATSFSPHSTAEKWGRTPQTHVPRFPQIPPWAGLSAPP